MTSVGRRLLVAAALAGLSACSTSAGSRPVLDEPTVTTSGSRPPATVAIASTVPTTTARTVAPLVAAACSSRLRIENAGSLPNELDEVSGIAASRVHKGVLWVIEDSGNPATVTAIGYDGTVRAALRLTGAPNVDWEDIAVAPGPDGRDWIYVADIGDNFLLRDHINVYRFAEPATLADATVPADRIERIEARYPTGPADAEALGVDASGTIWIITKVRDTKAILYRLDRSSSTLVPTATLDLRSAQATALDVSADSTMLVVRTYGSLRLIGNPASAGAAAVDCALPAPAEPQGESAAFLTDRDGIVTVSETTNGERAVLHLLVPG